jgi:hypothetical protein
MFRLVKCPTTVLPEPNDVKLFESTIHDKLGCLCLPGLRAYLSEASFLCSALR